MPDCLIRAKILLLSGLFGRLSGKTDSGERPKSPKKRHSLHNDYTQSATMIKALKKEVYEANMGLVTHHLVIFTWGNVSGYDPDNQLVVIKPSGVEYSQLSPDNLTVVDLDGNVVEGKYKPSSDTATHIALYKAFPELRGIVHTHSKWATIWAQAGKDIPALGTTHADYFYGAIPCTRPLTREEVLNTYELNTGRVIIERFHALDPLHMPGVLVHTHGPFSWGKAPLDALHNAVVLEQVAEMAWHTSILSQGEPMPQFLLDKHYLRKHGKDAYYGQTNS